MHPDRVSISHSQNFVSNPSLVAGLLNISSINEGDLVIEIGPGTGIITKDLIDRAGKVIAIERNESLYNKLNTKFTNTSKEKFQLVNDDFLQYKLPKIPYKVFANIPFNITSDIIKKLTSVDNPPSDTYLFVQKDAANRYIGKPNYKNTLVSMILKPWFETKIVHLFSKNDFAPVPNIDIVLLRIRKRDNPLLPLSEKQRFERFINYSFSVYKPTLKLGLRKVFSNLQFKLLAQEYQISLDSTPTDLTLEQWIGLFKFYLTLPQNTQKFVSIRSQDFKNNQKKVEKIHRTRRVKDWHIRKSS